MTQSTWINLSNPSQEIEITLQKANRKIINPINLMLKDEFFFKKYLIKKDNKNSSQSN